jgi:hypothetical protein
MRVKARSLSFPDRAQSNANTDRRPGLSPARTRATDPRQCWRDQHCEARATSYMDRPPGMQRRAPDRLPSTNGGVSAGRPQTLARNELRACRPDERLTLAPARRSGSSATCAGDARTSSRATFSSSAAGPTAYGRWRSLGGPVPRRSFRRSRAVGSRSLDDRLKASRSLVRGVVLRHAGHRSSPWEDALGRCELACCGARQRYRASGRTRLTQLKQRSSGRFASLAYTPIGATCGVSRSGPGMVSIVSIALVNSIGSSSMSARGLNDGSAMTPCTRRRCIPKLPAS